MRRVAISFVALLALLAGGSVASLAQSPSFQTAAPFAFLFDYDSGTVLLDKNADKPMIPASTTKILTAEIVFHELTEGRLKLDDKMTVSEDAWRQGGKKSGGSTMFARVHTDIRVEDLLRGLIVDSGNDAAIVLAEGIAGTQDAFATRMNKRAKEIGMTKSHFTNPWGRGDPDHVSTARDMARLALWVIKTYPELYKIFGEREFTWDKIRQQNRNPLLAMNIGADGLKTGNLKESGFGLVGSVVRNDQRLILVLNGLKTGKERAAEARKIIEWGFRAFEVTPLFAEGETVGTARVYGGVSSDVPLVADGPVRMLVPRGSDTKPSGKIVYKGPLLAPVEAGKMVAQLQIWRGKDQVLSVNLKTAASVAVGSLPKRALDAGIELASSFLFRPAQPR